MATSAYPASTHRDGLIAELLHRQRADAVRLGAAAADSHADRGPA
ncbi:hypothetical protein [Agrobacterium tumefaciens]|nr:hypothetical protein [Agrobacterium tumefaciens]